MTAAGLPLPRFVAEPAGPPPWPGVLVIHEGPGISPQLLRLCERLAAAGYAALAPDLYFRVGGTLAAEYGTLMGSLTPAQLHRDLATAVGDLRALGADPVGVTGFCFGGTITYRAALDDLGLAAAAPFYGGAIARELGEPNCPILCFFGGRDEYIPPDAIATVEAHHPGQVVVYPEAEHGFMRDGSSTYDEAAATDAWGRLLAFLAEHLT